MLWLRATTPVSDHLTSNPGSAMYWLGDFDLSNLKNEGQ